MKLGIWGACISGVIPVCVATSGCSVESRTPTATTAASLAAGAGAAFPLDDPNGAWQQASPALASNGTEYLVVWTDNRDVDGTSWDLYGARVTSAGDLIDSTPFVISAASGAQQAPSVASNGTDFFVAWEDVIFATDDASDTNVFGTRVSAAGDVLDPDGIELAHNTGWHAEPAVASSGADYIVTWQAIKAVAWSDTDADVYTTRVTNDGLVTDPEGVDISNAMSLQGSPVVASNGNGYLVVWTDYVSVDDVRLTGAILTADAAVQTPGIPIGTFTNGGADKAIASNGSNYMVVWTGRTESDPTRVRQVYATVVTESATQAPPAKPISNPAPSWVYRVTAASNGTDYFAVWMSNPDGGSDSNLYGSRISAAGVAQDPDALELSSVVDAYESTPHVAGTTDGYLVAYATGPLFPYGNHLTRVDARPFSPELQGEPDTDECSAGTDNCSANATCANHEGGFECVCNAGFTGDGIVCDPVTQSGGGCEATRTGPSAWLVLACVGLVLRFRRRVRRARH